MHNASILKLQLFQQIKDVRNKTDQHWHQILQHKVVQPTVMEVAHVGPKLADFPLQPNILRGEICTFLLKHDQLVFV